MSPNFPVPYLPNSTLKKNEYLRVSDFGIFQISYID